MSRTNVERKRAEARDEFKILMARLDAISDDLLPEDGQFLCAAEASSLAIHQLTPEYMKEVLRTLDSLPPKHALATLAYLLDYTDDTNRARLRRALSDRV